MGNFWAYLRSTHVMQYIPPNQQQGVSGEEFQEIFSVFLSLSALCVCKLSIAICWQTELSQKSVAYHYKIFVCLFVLIFKLYNIVLVLPYFSMNPPQVCTRSPSWTLLPPPSPYHPLWVVPVHQPQASSIVHRTWMGDSFHIWFNPQISSLKIITAQLKGLK